MAKQIKTRDFRKTSLIAIHELNRLGLNPIEMLAEVYKLAIDGYKTGRGMTEKNDNGAAWLAVARHCADNLASYKYPKLSAVAVKDLADDQSESKPMTTKEAIDIIKSDPMAPPQVTTEAILHEMETPREMNILPIGKKNE